MHESADTGVTATPAPLTGVRFLWLPRTSGLLALSIGIAIAAMLLAGLALTQLALNRIPFGDRGALNDLRIATVHCLLLGYLPAAYLHLRAMARRTLLALRPALDLDGPAFEQWLRSAGTIPRVWLVLVAVVGLGIAYLGPFLSEPSPGQPWDPATWTPEVAWHRVLGPIIGVWIGWFGYAIVRESHRLSRLAGALAPIDLLDLRPLAPFTRQGLAHALLTTGFLAVFGLFVVDQGITPLIAIITPLTLALALVSLLLPLRGVHHRIGVAKAAELAWVDRLIRGHADGLRGSHSGSATGGSLADLVAYRQLIERVREWLFDEFVLVRIVLYLLIPLASWLASALVGEVVERWFFTG